MDGCAGCWSTFLLVGVSAAALIYSTIFECEAAPTEWSPLPKYSKLTKSSKRHARCVAHHTWASAQWHGLRGAIWPPKRFARHMHCQRLRANTISPLVHRSAYTSHVVLRSGNGGNNTPDHRNRTFALPAGTRHATCTFELPAYNDARPRAWLEDAQTRSGSTSSEGGSRTGLREA
eukprot:6598948-Prymnesium_polylepis.1